MTKTFISLGAGVQSSAMALMAAHGLFEPMIPLRDVDFTSPAKDQAQFSFMDECDGMCGL